MSNDSKKASSPRILIVDDDLAVALMLGALLRSEGYLVDTVGSGVEALLKVSEKSYRAVICDIGLHDIRGTFVQKAMAARHPDLPVIMHTAEVSQKLRQECLDSGAFAYLTKPCDFDELKRVVREAVASGHGNGKE